MARSVLTHQLETCILVTTFTPGMPVSSQHSKVKVSKRYQKGSDNKYIRAVRYVTTYMAKEATDNVYTNAHGCVSIKFYLQKQESWGDLELVLLARGCPPQSKNQAHFEREPSRVAV